MNSGTAFASEVIAQQTMVANTPKTDLIRILHKLEDHKGCKRKARSLAKIIARLEAWQNTP